MCLVQLPFRLREEPPGPATDALSFAAAMEDLPEMVQELHAALLTRSDAPAPAATSASTNGKVSYVALAGSDTYHRADCSMVANKSNTAVLAPSSITRRKLQPCPLCDPVAVETNHARARHLAGDPGTAQKRPGGAVLGQDGRGIKLDHGIVLEERLRI